MPPRATTKTYKKCVPVALYLRTTLAALLSLSTLITPHISPAQSFTTTNNERGNPITDADEPYVLPQLFVSIALDRNEIYVGEQLNVTMEVLSPASAFNIRKQKLNIPATDIFTLEKHTVDTSRDSTPYRLETIRYAIYFKEPGRYTIPALKVTATLPVSAGGTNADSNPKISVQSAEQLITANQAPVPASQWLAASKLSIDANWLSAGNELQFIAGQPVSRQYVFSVTGQFPTAIPAVKFAFPSGLRHYQNPPQFEKHNDKSGVRGSLTQVVNLIPEQAGEYTLPALAVEWWDTTNQQWKTATMAEETISVHPGQYGSSHRSQTLYNTLIGLLAAFSVALSGLCFYLWRQLRRTRSTPVSATTEKQAWKALDHALKSTSDLTSEKPLKSQDALEIRRALTVWHAAINPTKDTNRIDQIATNDAEITVSLQQLEAQLFRHTNDTDSTNHSNQKLNVKHLRKQLKSYRQSLIAKTRTQSNKAAGIDSAVPISLYPSRSAD